MNIVQSVFTHSNATLVSSSARVNGHDVYDIQVTSPASAPANSTGSGNFNYNGDVFIDKKSMLPVQEQLAIQGFGKVTINLPMIVLDQPVDTASLHLCSSCWSPGTSFPKDDDNRHRHPFPGAGSVASRVSPVEHPYFSGRI